MIEIENQTQISKNVLELVVLVLVTESDQILELGGQDLKREIQNQT